MADMITTVEKVQEESLEALKAQHARALALLHEFAEGARDYWDSAESDRRSLPDPRELVASSLAFNQAVISETRSFTDQLFALWMPEQPTTTAKANAKNAS